MTASDARIDALIQKLDEMRAGGAPLAALVETAVKGLHESDERFNWTGVYELGADQVLHLGPYVGAATEHTAIPVGRGVCGTAVAQKRDLNIPDVRQVGNYLACSLRTRSELVVLIRKGETIYAQIDIDSHRVNAFDATATVKVERVAAWLSTAYAAAGTPRRSPEHPAAEAPAPAEAPASAETPSPAPSPPEPTPTESA
jgi:L-methionine (R)-S-oxide reductase